MYTMAKSQLTRLLDELCCTSPSDSKFLEIAVKVKHAYEEKCNKPKIVRKKRVKICSDCGSQHIECKDEDCTVE